MIFSFPKPEIFTSVINGYFSEPYASLMNGILFGVELQTSQTFYNQVKIVGLLHIVVLSGINITLLGAVVGNITKHMGKRSSATITIAVIVLFIIFVGPDPPIVRAGIMGVISLLAIIYERQSTALYALFLSGLGIAVVRFEWITGISFQLSFGATLGIILFGSVKERTYKNPIKKFFHEIHKELKPSLASSVFTVPTIFWYFKEISTISPVSNILTAFIMPPLMVFGFATAILGKVHYVLGLIPAYISFGLLWYVVFVIRVLAELPYIFFSLSGM